MIARGAILALLCAAACALPPSPDQRARADAHRVETRLAALVRALPTVTAAEVLVAIAPNDPLAPGPRPPPRATIAVTARGDTTALTAAARAAALTALGPDAEVTVVALAAPPLTPRSRRGTWIVLALAVAAAATALTLALARRRAVARYRGISPQ